MGKNGQAKPPLIFAEILTKDELPVRTHKVCSREAIAEGVAMTAAPKVDIPAGYRIGAWKAGKPIFVK